MIIVTGCSGFIGFHLSKELLNNNLPVLGIDNLISSQNILKNWRLEQLKNYGINFIDVDITNKAELNKKIRDINFSGNFSTIYHLAGLAGVRQSVLEPKKYYNNNVMGTINMLNIATEFSLESFVFASSSSVYGLQDNRIPFVENETLESPQSPYAFSKLFAELISKDYSNISSLNVSLLRFFTVYGPAGRIDMSILKFIHNIINENPINIYGDGFQERDFTYVEDICEGIIKSSRVDGFETFNLGSSQPYSIIKVLSMLKEIINKEPKIEYLPKHYADVNYTWANIDKAKSLLKWHPKTSLENGLEKTVDWYKNNKDLLASTFEKFN